MVTCLHITLVKFDLICDGVQIQWINDLMDNFVEYKLCVALDRAPAVFQLLD